MTGGDIFSDLFYFCTLHSPLILEERKFHLSIESVTRWKQIDLFDYFIFSKKYNNIKTLACEKYILHFTIVT